MQGHSRNKTTSFAAIFNNNVVLRKVLVVSFAFFALYVFRTALVVSLDKTPPRWDHAQHLLASLDYAEIIKKNNLSHLFTHYGYYYPPLVYALMGFLVLLSGLNTTTTLVLNGFFLLFGLVGSYFFLQRVAGKTAALATAVFSMVFFLGFRIQNPPWWELMLEIPLVTTTLVAYCALYDALTNKRHSVSVAFYLALLIVASFLIKWSSVLFLVVPTVYYFLTTIRQSSIKASIVYVITIGVLGLGWYSFHLSSLASDFYTQQLALSVPQQKTPGADAALAYVVSFFQGGGWVATVSALLLFGSFVYAIKNTGGKNAARRAAPLYLVFTHATWLIVLSFFARFNDARYALPGYVVFISFGFLLFWKTIETRNAQIIGFVFLVAAMAWSLGRPFPITTDQPILEKLTEIIKQNQTQTFAYFFEEETASFNFLNVRLMYKIQQQKSAKRPYWFINAPNNEEEASEEDRTAHPDVLVVYSNKNPIGGGFFRDENLLAFYIPDFFIRYTEKESIETKDESLFLYKKR